MLKNCLFRAEIATTVLNAVRMAQISGRCGFSICGKGRKKLHMEYTPAARQKVPIRQHFQICRLQNASGNPMRTGGTDRVYGSCVKRLCNLS